MSPVPSVFPEDTAQMQQVATALLTPSLWKTIALPLAAVLCLLLYLHRRRHPADQGLDTSQPALVFEKRQTSTYTDSAPPLPPPHASVDHLSRQYDPWFIPAFGSATAPLPLPTMRRHSCHMSQQAPPPTSTHYTRRTSTDSIGPARSIRGSIMRGSPLAPGVRRNQWTIEIR